MTRMRVRIYGDPVLRKKAGEVTEFDEDLVRFLDDMVETMMTEDGVGLAAPQVGVSKRIVVLNEFPGDPETLMKIVNPVVTLIEDETESVDEGCLSVPGIRGKVTRPVALRMTWQDETGKSHEIEAEGLLARIIQHEVDHLDGILFVDRLSLGKRALIRGQLRELRKRSGEDS
ncbi:MAG TPA: peptide deformylase [Candidatus Krumholzibacterium sp.]|nr:peptide deformylase [Candidatus Krumholzibacterium sp.]